ncbi:MAG: hypothetical protein WA908_04915 [Pontixanthobacter sp.]
MIGSAILAALATAGTVDDDLLPRDPVAIASTAFRPIDFVPVGWKLFDKFDGDLNGDDRIDAAIVIQRNDPQAIIADPDGLGMDRYDANPRILLIALRNHLWQYRIVSRNDRIIPDHDSPTIGDPYEDMRIADGVLHFDLDFFANAGSWETYNRRFQFRWNGAAMALIGFDMTHVHRGSGVLRQTSVNYLTGKRKDADGSIEDDTTEWRWSDISPDHRPVMSEIGNGFRFEG